MIVSSNTAHISYKGSFTLDEHLAVLRTVNKHMSKHVDAKLRFIVIKNTAGYIELHTSVVKKA